jgi:hypothetical protein
MATLVRIGVFAGGFILLGFAAVVVLHLVTGRIPLAGLLDSKAPDGRPSFSPARLQMLIFTVVVAAQYLHAVIVNPTQDSLPALPQGVVAALGGSHAVYLGGKAFTTYIQPLLKKLN